MCGRGLGFAWLGCRAMGWIGVSLCGGGLGPGGSEQGGDFGFEGGDVRVDEPAQGGREVRRVADGEKQIA